MPNIISYSVSLTNFQSDDAKFGEQGSNFYLDYINIDMRSTDLDKVTDFANSMLARFPRIRSAILTVYVIGKDDEILSNFSVNTEIKRVKRHRILTLDNDQLDHVVASAKELV